MKIHMRDKWADNTKCGQVIYRATCDVSRIYIFSVNLRKDRRGVTCKSCLRKKP